MSTLLEKIERAFAERKPFFELMASQKTNCYRLFCGEGEGISGLIVDRYGDFGVLQFHEGRCELSTAELGAVAEWYREKLSLQAIYLKNFVADRSHSQRDESLYSSTPFVGQAFPPSVPVFENGLKYVVRPYEGFSTGIFLDQRKNRRFLSELVGKGRLLNTFSYTCGFSVAAASRGATTVSVDVSKKNLEWGKENFQINSLPLDSQRFLAVDAFEFIKRAGKRGEVFDLVIVDPPSFSRTREGKVFSIARDLKKLVSEARAVVASGGYLFVSSNYASWTTAYLGKQMEEWLSQGWQRKALPPLDEDFKRQTHSLSYCLFQKD